VAAVTTDLHRRLLYQAGPASRAVVFVDGSALFRDPEALDPDALDLDGIHKALRAYRPETERSRDHFQVHYGRVSNPHRNGQWLLRCGLEGLGRQADFGWAGAQDTFRNDDFSFAEFVAPLKGDAGAGALEAAVGDDRVKAYPVRTALSRILTGSAAGVVDVRPALDPSQADWVPAEVERSARAAIGGLKLARGKKVNLLFNLPGRDDRPGDRVQQLCKRWAAEHGLELGSYSY
jgi:hypothetical protein